jgi:hypothetical protein
MAVWYSLWSFWNIFPFWYVWIKKNLATLTAVVVYLCFRSTFENFQPGICARWGKTGLAFLLPASNSPLSNFHKFDTRGPAGGD